MSASLAEATVVISGLGLMGGSLAMALERRAARLVGVDADPGVVGVARRRKMVDLAVDAADCRDWAARADVLVLAVPLGQMRRFVAGVCDQLRPGTVVTDLGGAKARVMREIAATLPPGVEYVPGHPMTGSERQGIRGARADLYRGATWILVGEAPPPLGEMIEAVGAVPLQLDPQVHDRIAAHTSHLPLLMAAVTAGVCAEAARGDEALFRRLAAGGFRDTTRVAAGGLDMGTDMCLYNAAELLPAVERARERLGELASALQQRDRAGIRAALENGRTGRIQIAGDG